MASQFQMVECEGYMGDEPSMKFMGDGTAVVNFSLASTNEYKRGDEKIKETTWYRVTAWGKTAEVINQYCKKGTHIWMWGRLRPDENGSPRVFQRKDGSYSSSYEVTLERLRILDSKETSSSSHVSTVSEDEMPW